MLFASAFGVLKLYIYCYYGKCATDNYAAFAHCLYEMNWMILPIDLQKSLILLIAHAQKPISYHGYNIVDLNLNTFTRVRSDVIPSFDVLHTISPFLYFVDVENGYQLLFNVQNIGIELGINHKSARMYWNTDMLRFG